MQTHLRKYICSTGRKEASRSECYETLDVGCPASSVSHLLYLNTVGVRGGNSFASARFLRASPSPGTLVVQPSAGTLRDSIKSDHDRARSHVILPKYLSLLRAGSIDDVSIPQQRCCRLSLGKFDNFQPFAPARTWAQLWLMILPRQTHFASLFSCVTSPSTMYYTSLLGSRIIEARNEPVYSTKAQRCV